MTLISSTLNVCIECMKCSLCIIFFLLDILEGLLLFFRLLLMLT